MTEEEDHVLGRAFRTTEAATGRGHPHSCGANPRPDQHRPGDHRSPGRSHGAADHGSGPDDRTRPRYRRTARLPDRTTPGTRL